MKSLLYILAALLLAQGCKKKDPPSPPVTPAQLTANSVQLNGAAMADNAINISRQPLIRVQFSEAVNRSTLPAAVKLTAAVGSPALNISYENNDAVVLIQPSTPLNALTRYNFSIDNSVKIS